MTYALGGGRGSPKSRQKEQKQLICDSDKGERGSKNPKILWTSYMEAPKRGEGRKYAAVYLPSFT